MSWSTVVKYSSLTWQLKKISILSAMSYPTSFFIQVVGMVFNHGAWIILWAFFFKQFPTVNGWSFEHTILLYAFGALAFAFCTVPAEGVFYLTRYVISGELDTYFTLPQHILWSVAVSKLDLSTLGDGLFGLLLAFYVYGFALGHIAWFLLLSLFAGILLFDFLVVAHSFSFWFGDIDEVVRRMVYMLLGFMFYPQTIFTGLLKVVTMTILPAFFIVNVPISLIISFSWDYFFLLLMSVILGTTFALWFFNKGLARYESGNLMTTRQ